MRPADRRRSVHDERGVALPLAMMALALLAAVTAAFVAMAGMEPLIADNHRASHQALRLAEAAIERTIWALDNPAAPGSGIPEALVGTAPAPYDDSRLIALGRGGYSMRVCAPDAVTCPPKGTTSRDRNMVAAGYVVREGTALPATPRGVTDANRVSQKTLQVTLIYIGPPTTPGALTAGGSVELTGNATIDGRDLAEGAPNSCARQAGVTIRGTTTGPGPDGRLGTGDDLVTTNTVASSGAATVGGSPTIQTLDEETFNQNYLFSHEQLESLREHAKQQAADGKATYIKPGSNAPIHLEVTDGLIFVDTVDGVALGRPPDPATLADVKIASADNAGWIIVMGSLTIDGDVTYDGLLYAVDDLQYRGTGRISGAVVSANILDTKATVIDGASPGQPKIYYDCQKVANGGGSFEPPRGYVVKRGSWREVTN